MFVLISDLAKIQDENNSSDNYNWQTTYHESLKQVIKDSELEERAKDKVKKVESLLYTMMDSFNKYSSFNITYEEKQKSLNKIFNKIQVEQRSSQWYEDMKSMLTASEFSYLFESPRTVGNLVLSKINQEKRDSQKPCRTESLVATGWGIRFEPIVRNYLEETWKSKIYECGRLKHETNTHLGASPDGIIIESEDMNKYGRLVEIKCPYSRKIGEGIPFNYWVQMQIQMEVTNLFECEYVEVEILSKKAKQLDVDLSGNYLYKGTVYLMEKEYIYEYIYDSISRDNYLEKGYDITEEIPYAIVNIYNVCVKRDKEWYETTKPKQEQFWKDVASAKEGNYVLAEPKFKRQKKEVQCLITEET